MHEPSIKHSRDYYHHICILLTSISLRQKLPVCDISLSSEVCIVGHEPVRFLELAISIAGTASENDSHSNSATIAHQSIQALQRSQPHQVFVQCVVYICCCWRSSSVEHLAGEGNSNRVESHRFDLVHNRRVASDFQTLKYVLTALKTIPD